MMYILYAPLKQQPHWAPWQHSTLQHCQICEEYICVPLLILLAAVDITHPIGGKDVSGRGYFYIKVQ